MLNEIICGDNREVLKTFEDNSFDSIVTDPPYDLTTTKRWSNEDSYSKSQSDVGKRFSKGFMGMNWDGTGIAFDFEFWKECLRVLKPGGHLLAFGGTRTYHRMVCAIEDAGFEIRDTIQWIYGSGFPKSLDISKAIDAKFGAKREVIGDKNLHVYKTTEMNNDYGNLRYDFEKTNQLTAPSSEEAKRYSGWGTNLKPANEPIVVARKPIEENTIAENVLKFGTGGINIDGCRIGRNEKDRIDYGINGDENPPHVNCYAERERVEYNPHSGGRFPANVIFECICSPSPTPSQREGGNKPYEYKDKEYEVEGFIKNIKPNSPSNYNDKNLRTVHTNPDCPCYILDQQSGVTKSSGGSGEKSMGALGKNGKYGRYALDRLADNAGGLGDIGGASRFFYVAKASRSEREYGLKEFEKKLFGQSGGALTKLKNGETEYLQEDHIGLNKIKSVGNNHPTVKPISLMKYLIRLVTPPNGKVLDPFAGSGTTGIAAKLEGFDFVGIEKEEDYCLIARARIEAWQVEEVQENLFRQNDGGQVNEAV
ncbi:MAG: DNA methyltransferase [Candidatus Doudnabacteria bacterium]